MYLLYVRQQNTVFWLADLVAISGFGIQERVDYHNHGTDGLRVTGTIGDVLKIFIARVYLSCYGKTEGFVYASGFKHDVAS